MARHDDPRTGALRVASIYLAVAVVWVVFSDHAVVILFQDASIQARVQTIKGTVFVVASAVVIFGLVYRELRARRRVENRYRILVDQALVGIYVIRGERFLFANPRLAEVLGHDPDTLLDRVSVRDVVDESERDAVLESLRQREHGEIDELQYRLTGRRADGKPVRLEVHGRRLDWDGEPAVMGLALDVTERERLETELQQARRLEALGRVTGAVVHDFNNFLTAIILPMELCSDRMDPADPGREELLEARQSTQRAVDLTRKLLAFSRGTPYRSRRVDLSQLVRRMKPVMSRLCGDALRLELELADDLPPVEVDPHGFEQVLVNLVVNAREAQTGRGTLRIHARRGTPEEGASEPRVALEVTDEGAGMDEETRLRAVEPFFSTKEGGSGLGLATVHGIVSQARGELAIESAPGRGTTVRIRLPGVEGEPEPLEAEPSAPGSVNVSAIEGARVLVIDDDEAVRRVLLRVLARYGLATYEARTASEALELARVQGREVDLVVADLGLPDLDGLELVSRIDRLIPGTPVLYISGQSSEEVIARLAEDRNRRFIEKPFSIDVLMGEVAAALGERRGRTMSAKDPGK